MKPMWVNDKSRVFEFVEDSALKECYFFYLGLLLTIFSPEQIIQQSE